jgi:hypothetical protein
LRQQRFKPSPPNQVEAAERSRKAVVALMSLPSREEAGAALARITARIDSIVEKAEAQSSLAVALIGLRELRSTIEVQAKLSGYLGTNSANIQVNTQVNLDLGQAVKELIAAIQPDKTNGSSALDRLEALFDAE